jgi:hypothetical protein
MYRRSVMRELTQEEHPEFSKEKNAFLDTNSNIKREETHNSLYPHVLCVL